MTDIFSSTIKSINKQTPSVNFGKNKQVCIQVIDGKVTIVDLTSIIVKEVIHKYFPVKERFDEFYEAIHKYRFTKKASIAILKARAEKHLKIKIAAKDIPYITALMVCKRDEKLSNHLFYQEKHLIKNRLKVDVIILSDAKNNILKQLTQQTITTCKKSEKNIDFRFIVFEKQPNVKYKGDNIDIYPQTLTEFNYNRYMNMGIKKSTAKYVVLCNNDLKFTPNWCSNSIMAMRKYGALSSSPICPNVQGKIADRLFTDDVSFGYTIREHVSGWCILVDRKIFDSIKKIKENVSFWASDHIYADQLKRKKIKHILVKYAVVYHLSSQTLHTLPADERQKITWDEHSKYLQLRNMGNPTVEHAFCINMPKAHDRWSEFQIEAAKTKIIVERSDGVDGAPYCLTSELNTLKRGNMGCLIAHRNAIEMAKLRGYKNILIFEDDAQLSKNFDKELNAAFNELPEDYCVLRLHKDTMCEPALKEHSALLSRTYKSFGTYGYVVNSKYFTEITKILCEEIGKMHTDGHLKTLDVIYCEYMHVLPFYETKKHIVFHKQGYSYRTNSTPPWQHLDAKAMEQ